MEIHKYTHITWANPYAFHLKMVHINYKANGFGVGQNYEGDGDERAAYAEWENCEVRLSFVVGRR